MTCHFKILSCVYFKLQLGPRNLNKNSFWVKVREEQLENEDVMKELSATFASKPGKDISVIFSFWNF